MGALAELHLHIEGTLEPEFLWELANKNGEDIGVDLAEGAKAASIDALKRRYDFGNLQEFLDIYSASVSALKSSEDFEALADAYFARAQANGISIAEIFFDPETHIANGRNFGEVFDGLARAAIKAKSKFGIEAAYIMCFERNLGVDCANQTLDAAFEYLDLASPAHRELLIGVGMDSTEIGIYPGDFAEPYQRARGSGLHAVAHAGEEGPAEYIWSALDDLGAERIDHGVHALDDAELLRRLAADKIPLTCCPLSNVALKVFPSPAASAEAIRRLLDAGVVVTINSDDPAYFGGYLNDNFAMLAANGFSDGDISLLKENSIKAKFHSMSSCDARDPRKMS